MAITAIAEVKNASNSTIMFWNQEKYHPTEFQPYAERFAVEPGETRTTLEHKDDSSNTKAMDIWIPWCSSASEFRDLHFITVQVQHRTLTFCIWQAADQDGDFVRFSRDCHYHGKNDGMSRIPGVRVPGYNRVGGKRRLEITASGELLFHLIPG